MWETYRDAISCVPWTQRLRAMVLSAMRDPWLVPLPKAKRFGEGRVNETCSRVLLCSNRTTCSNASQNVELPRHPGFRGAGAMTIMYITCQRSCCDIELPVDSKLLRWSRIKSKGEHSNLRFSCKDFVYLNILGEGSLHLKTFFLSIIAQEVFELLLILWPRYGSC